MEAVSMKTLATREIQAFLARRAVMGLPRWRRTGGRDFVFYHSHPGFEWDDLDITNAYQETICNDFQVRLAQPNERSLSPPGRRLPLRPAVSITAN